MIYRVLQPGNSSILCKAYAAAETIQCPTNPMHQRAGRYTTNLSIASMPRKRNARSSFCYSWTWRYLASNGLIEELNRRGITGFRSVQINTKDILEAGSFSEFRVQWNGEFSASTDHLVARSYCADCGLVQFDVYGDPPWSMEDLVSESDFFYLAPSFYTFCSQRAYEAMTDLCGKEFLAVPASEPTFYPETVNRASFSWPYNSLPELRGDQSEIWSKLLRLDPNGVLPRQMPIAPVTESFQGR